MTIREYRATDLEAGLARDWALKFVPAKDNWSVEDVVVIKTSRRKYVRKARIISIAKGLAELKLLNRLDNPCPHSRLNGLKGGRPKTDLSKLDAQVPQGCSVVRQGSYLAIVDSETGRTHLFRSAKSLVAFAKQI